MNNKLTALYTLLRVAETGSFSAAARQSEMSQSAVSQQITALEAELGAVLLHRTTRSLALTDAGKQYLQQITPLLNALEEADASLHHNTRLLKGRVRIQMPGGLGHQLLLPALVRLQQLNPELQLDMLLEDRVADIIAEGVDVALRLSETPPSGLAYQALAIIEQGLVASPTWLQRAGMPTQPQALATLPHIRFSRHSLSAPLTLLSTAGERCAVPVPVVFRASSSQALLSALEAGLGVGAMQLPLVADALARGSLVRVLPEWRLPDRQLFALWPDARFIPQRVRSVVSCVREALAGVTGVTQQ